MDNKQLDISTLEAKCSSEQIAEYELKREAYYRRLIEAHEASERGLSNVKRATYWVRQAEAVELIEALKWQDLSRATKWVKKHKERLTDVSTLAEILAMARAYGASDKEEDDKEKSREHYEKTRKAQTKIAFKKWAEDHISKGATPRNAPEIRELTGFKLEWASLVDGTIKEYWKEIPGAPAFKRGARSGSRTKRK